MEESCQNFARGENNPGLAGPGYDAMSRRVIRALRIAFPGAASNNDLADRASSYFFNRDGEPIDPRTIRNWLDGISLPRAEHLFALIIIVGADFFGLPRRGGRS